MRLRRSGPWLAAISGFVMILGSVLGEICVRTSYASVTRLQAEPNKKKIPPPTQPQKPAARPPRRLPSAAFEYLIWKRGGDGRPIETNQNSTFAQGEQIQLTIKPNRDGYLYIISSFDEEDGEKIFPNSRMGGVQNYLTKNKEFNFPQDCEASFKDAQGTCWLTLQPRRGKALITVYFSIDKDIPPPSQPDGKIDHQEIVTIRKLAGLPTDTTHVYGKQVAAAPKSPAVVAKIDLSVEPPTLAGNEGSAPPKVSGQGSAVNPPPPTGSTPPASPSPESIWKRLDNAYENQQANGVRVALYRQNADGRESVSPAQTAFGRGEKIKLDLLSNYQGFVYVVAITPTGRALLVFPDKKDVRIQASTRYVIPGAQAWLELPDEKGIHTLQVILAGERIPQLEDVIKSKDRRFTVDLTPPKEAQRSQHFDCTTLAGVVNWQRLNNWRRRGVQLAPDAYLGQGGAIALVAGQYPSQPEQGPEACSQATAELTLKAEGLNKKELAIFEIRLKQE